MFRQKKKNHTWLYACLGLTAAILAVFFLIGTLRSNHDEAAQRVNLASQAESPQAEQDLQAPARNGQAEKQTDSVPLRKSDENPFFQSYYLVKYDNHDIKIFFSDETGKMTLFETTGIVFETLSTQDQQRFAAGIKANNREELNRLIMDYES